ncbi:MAG: SIS domain-containing protein [Candidatus Microthrix parvicella]|mgnify:FL=1|uniref:Putative Mannose-6-phosphate isomerase n=1 Tax=Candidatus Neomicrothrix parvicella RN1 TaxID=1229780 RepID=R4YYE1_9ACTN|nr:MULTISPECIES: SIS domain-containing protein [Microthrix]MBK6501185.1 SIS domain-containing protein [Candidatus Microthrix sp.]CCM61971.1 putative Mannose-6-phosphate isomerase [Candidatus Microthrix parvicella RN1]
MSPTDTGVLDTLGMFDAAFGLPDQMAAAVELASSVDGLPDASAVTSILVLGMGGSGISGDIMALVASEHGRVPVEVSRHYELPSHVGPHTLVMAVSFSGDTEETVVAAEAAVAAGAPVVAVTTGGALGDLVSAAGGGVCGLPKGIPLPRAALGAVGLTPVVLATRLGLLNDTAAAVDAAIEAVAGRLGANAGASGDTDNEARTLARHIERTQPIIYGGGRTGELAAYRWKGQVNENAKAPAYWGSVPEVCHNEICAWGQHGDVTRQVNSMVYLRHDGEHPNVSRRFDFLAQITAEVVAEIFEVRAKGDGSLANFYDLAAFGDLVSLWMAAEAGVDPGPIPAISDLKAYLAG